MAFMVIDDCNGCAACEPECPNEAISTKDEIFVIDPNKCTECVGHHNESKCVQACPMDCILPDPEYREGKDELLQKYQRLAQVAS